MSGGSGIPASKAILAPRLLILAKNISLSAAASSAGSVLASSFLKDKIISVKFLLGTNSGTSEVSTHKNPQRFLTILSTAPVLPTLFSSITNLETVDAALACKSNDSSALILSINDRINGVNFFGNPESFRTADE
ncbi:hypothetical protein OGATHE_005430 [Ogataea polymorpha]|uniref:Uncharacterized protein n=1 Tax=Ogataea polymorpha TaxID=460523 RepID=A0A9P8NWX9_9ASCO|nr:hypothetical protein OGATHE_005430 [Ogataea polymorpha]